MLKNTELLKHSKITQQANDNNPLFGLASIPRDLMQPA